jgi:hypothetical protein
MSDDVKPPEKPTVRMEQVPDWAVALSQSVNVGFRSVNERLDKLEGSDKSISDEVQRLSRDVVDLRADGRRFDEDIRRLSERTKDTSARASQGDLEQASQLAQEKVAREALAAEVADLKATNATQLAILGRLDKVASNPLVKTLGAMLATALITYLATHGIQVPK